MAYTLGNKCAKNLCKRIVLTHSLTAALDQLRVVASSTSNDPGPRSRQHQQIGQRLLILAAANFSVDDPAGASSQQLPVLLQLIIENVVTCFFLEHSVVHITVAQRQFLFILLFLQTNITQWRSSSLSLTSYRQTDRQTDRQTQTQTDRQTDRQTDTDRQTERQTDRQTERQTER